MTSRTTGPRQLQDSAGSMNVDDESVVNYRNTSEARSYGGVLDSSTMKRAEEGARRDALTLGRKLAYSVGHVLNDLAASMWFTYFILFYHMVLRVSNAYAGLLVLIGQIADAMATPLVGYMCDTTDNKYGGRKTWHLIGSFMVGVSLFFFWHKCIYCDQEPLVPYQMIYYGSFIVAFQFGWATVQVSHLALIPQLTADENERVGLTSWRYSATIFSNLGVFVAMFILLATVNSSGKGGFATGGKLSPDDQWIFSGIALGMIAVGSVFVIIYHVGVREPPRKKAITRNSVGSIISDTLPIYKWFLNPQFYLVGVVYMSSRLIVNLTQVYGPLYILDSIGLSRLSVAIFPLVIYLSGLGTSFSLKKLNKIIGRYLVYFIGLCFVVIASAWFRFWPSVNDSDSSNSSTNANTSVGDDVTIPQLPNYSVTVNFVYAAAILTGIGGTTLLVTSLSMVADLIGKYSGSSAFVYGAMSFTDKLSNGIAIQLIQIFHPCKGSGENVCCSKCGVYYRRVMSYAPGGACVIAFVGLMLVVIMIKFRAKGCRAPHIMQLHQPGRHTIQSNSSSYDESAPLIK